MILKFFYSLAGILTLVCPLLATSPSQAPEDSTGIIPKSLSLKGSMDVYYQYDFLKNAANTLTSFTKSHNSFELGMASLAVGHETGKVSMLADLGFGKRVEEFSYNDQNTRFAIKQLLVKYAVTDNFSLTAGSWTTHVGFELLDAYLNRNYTMSYLFSYGPFFHTGIKADLSLGNSGFMLGVADPTDLKSATIPNKFIIGQYSFTNPSEKFHGYLNVQAGKPDDDHAIAQADLVITQSLTDKLTLGVNASLMNIKEKKESQSTSNSQWYGAALYLQGDFSEKAGFSVRSELFNDPDQLNVFSNVANGGRVWANTLSFNYKVDNFILIPELRFENASESLFVNVDGEAKNSGARFTIAAIYHFE